MARVSKSSPLAVRLTPMMVQWIEEHARSSGITKTAVVEEALGMLKASVDRKRQKLVKQELMRALRRSS